jgi:hypothetical protein
MIRAAFGALMALLASCAPAEMPAVSVMSALPLFWGEGGPAEVLQGDDQRAPVIKHLSARHPLLPLDRIDAASLSRAPLLLIAQPRGLSPEELVALDAWLRSGGKALIFADPLLLWPSDLAMGDRRRAPLTSLLDPLFAHWQIRLDGPAGNSADEAVIASDGISAVGAGVGHWKAAGKMCVVGANDRIVECAIGKGKALLIADADLLDFARYAENAALIDSLLLRVAR